MPFIRSFDGQHVVWMFVPDNCPSLIGFRFVAPFRVNPFPEDGTLLMPEEEPFLGRFKKQRREDNSINNKIVHARLYDRIPKLHSHPPTPLVIPSLYWSHSQDWPTSRRRRYNMNRFTVIQSILLILARVTRNPSLHRWWSPPVQHQSMRMK